MTSIAAFYLELLARWQDRSSSDLLQGSDGVVLAGAGTVGRQFLAALRLCEIPILAFTDNGADKWGTTVRGVSVLSPQDAVARFGRSATFIVAIGRVGQDAVDIVRQFAMIGANRVMHFTEAIRLLPEIWPQFFANPADFTPADADRCAAAYQLFHDDESRRHFMSHLQWRVTLDPVPLATPDYDHQYFPRDLIAPGHCRVFVDVGAYTGDTLATLDTFGADLWEEYYGFEPDPISYAALQSEAAAISTVRPRVRIVTKLTAIGATVGDVCFSGQGAATSQVDAAGAIRVPCATLDSLSIADPTYVKIDVEGAEAGVLQGGTETLGRSKPTIAIASYHHPTDLFDLPIALAKIAPDYRFHLRSHGDAGIDLVCYAIREAA